MTRTARQKALRRQSKEARITHNRPACPTPEKKQYETEEAIHKALRSSKYLGKPVHIYKCQCGYLHLTKQPNPKTK